MLVSANVLDDGSFRAVEGLSGRVENSHSFGLDSVRYPSSFELYEE